MEWTGPVLYDDTVRVPEIRESEQINNIPIPKRLGRDSAPHPTFLTDILIIILSEFWTGIAAPAHAVLNITAALDRADSTTLDDNTSCQYQVQVVPLSHSLGYWHLHWELHLSLALANHGRYYGQEL